jgi:hypothetical protein
VFRDPPHRIRQRRWEQAIQGDGCTRLVPSQVLFQSAGFLKQDIPLLLLQPDGGEQLPEFLGMELGCIHQIPEQQLQLGGRLMGCNRFPQPIAALLTAQRRWLAGTGRGISGCPTACALGLAAAAPAAGAITSQPGVVALRLIGIAGATARPIDGRQNPLRLVADVEGGDRLRQQLIGVTLKPPALHQQQVVPAPELLHEAGELEAPIGRG